MQSLADFIASIPDSPRGILRFVSSLLLTHGYVVIFIGAALDNFGLPASGDIVLFAGGWFSNLGRAALPLVMLSGFAGERPVSWLPDPRSPYWPSRLALSRGSGPLPLRVRSPVTVAGPRRTRTGFLCPIRPLLPCRAA